MYRDDRDGHRDVREQLVRYSIRLLDDGLAVGSAGNMSVRVRRAAILGSHGAVSYGATLAEAYDRALLLEWLAHVHRLACSRGEPRILTEAELDEVAAEVRRRGRAGGRGQRAGGRGQRAGGRGQEEQHIDQQ